MTGSGVTDGLRLCRRRGWRRCRCGCRAVLDHRGNPIAARIARGDELPLRRSRTPFRVACRGVPPRPLGLLPLRDRLRLWRRRRGWRHRAGGRLTRRWLRGAHRHGRGLRLPALRSGRLRRPAVCAAEIGGHLPGFREFRLDGHVDDGALFGVGVAVVPVLGVDPAADHPAGTDPPVTPILPSVRRRRPVREIVHAGAFGLDGGAVLQGRCRRGSRGWRAARPTRRAGWRSRRRTVRATPRRARA